jgi:hypothetical protein
MGKNYMFRLQKCRLYQAGYGNLNRKIIKLCSITVCIVLHSYRFVFKFPYPAWWWLHLYSRNLYLFSQYGKALHILEQYWYRCVPCSVMMFTAYKYQLYINKFCIYIYICIYIYTNICELNYHTSQTITYTHTLNYHRHKPVILWHTHTSHNITYTHQSHYPIHTPVTLSHIHTSHNLPYTHKSHYQIHTHVALSHRHTSQTITYTHQSH